MNTCPLFNDCANANKACFKCFDYGRFQAKKEVKSLQNKSLHRKEKKLGMDFENRGINAYNKTITRSKEMASKQINSGAFSFALGDMITEDKLTAALAEFKERAQTSSSGQKQITIKKEWLDKLKWEAGQMQRDYYFLPFSFSGSNQDYVAMEYDLLLSYVQTIQMLLQTLETMQKIANFDE